jgi:hypothetical protein
MRWVAVALLLTALPLPAFSAQPVTVTQLERLLQADRGKRDGAVAHQLAGLEMTERLSSARVARLETDLPGTHARQALELLSDLSAFLGLPAEEIEATAAPDLAGQRAIIARAVDYAIQTMHKLPNLFAMRNTVLYYDRPASRLADFSLVPYEPLHAASRSSDTVLYRDGHEVVDSGKQKRKNYDPAAEALVTRGVFGPLMGIALKDAAHGSVSWSHWERGASGPLAVFQFVVPKAMSHYEVTFCCFTQSFGRNQRFDKISAYHGELAIDPADGSILRQTVVANLEKSDPILRSDILVEYGTVEIGGRNYICPVKSVAVWVAPVADPKVGLTLLTDAVFTGYHLFRSDFRLLTGDEAADQ